MLMGTIEDIKSNSSDGWRHLMKDKSMLDKLEIKGVCSRKMKWGMA